MSGACLMLSCPDYRSGIAPLADVPVVPPDTRLLLALRKFAPVAEMPVELSYISLLDMRRLAPEAAETPVVLLESVLLLAFMNEPLTAAKRPVPDPEIVELFTFTIELLVAA